MAGSNNRSNSHDSTVEDTDSELNQYMLINKQISKALTKQRSENANLKNSLRILESDMLLVRMECYKWKNKFFAIKQMYMAHTQSITLELQTNDVKIHSLVEDCDDDIKLNEFLATSPPKNLSRSVDSSRRVSKSFETTKNRSDRRRPEHLTDIETIVEEDEDVSSPGINRCNVEESKDILNRSVENGDESKGSEEDSAENGNESKESDVDSLENGDGSKGSEEDSAENGDESKGSDVDSVENSEESEDESIGKSLSQKSLKKLPANKNNLNTSRSLCVEPKDNSIDKTFGNMKAHSFVSSTPYRNSKIINNNNNDSVVDKAQSTTIRSSAAISIASQVSISNSVASTESQISASLSSRPRRKATPVILSEPKLNTKLRRPR